MSVARFEWYTREEARAKLEAMEPTGDNHADRIRLERRANLEVTTPAERAAVRAYNKDRNRAKARAERTPAKRRNKSPGRSAKGTRNNRKR
jgi:hypothetical protein